MGKATFIDLFAGVGGIRLGMEAAGFECAYSCEIDGRCRETYRANFGEDPAGDIRLIDAAEIPEHDILCAGFPCQPFSKSGRLKGFADPRGTLFFEILRILEAKRPRALLLENVKNLASHNGGATLAAIESSLKGLGYRLSWEILNASDFGVPQHRERIIIVGSLEKGFDFSGVKRRPRGRIADILEDSGEHGWLEPSEYTLIADPKPQNSGMIFAGYVNKSMRRGMRPGGEHMSRVHRQQNRIYSDFGIHPTLSSSELAGRYHILTEGGVRRLTLNECWRLMGFPESFVRPVSKTAQYAQIGNSVAVPMVEAVASEVKRQIFS